VSKSIYMWQHTPSHMVSSISDIKHVSHKWPIFEGLKSCGKTNKMYANTFSDALWHCHYPPKKNAYGAGLRQLSNPVHNHFFKNLFRTRSRFPKYCFLHSMGSCALKLRIWSLWTQTEHFFTTRVENRTLPIIWVFLWNCSTTNHFFCVDWNYASHLKWRNTCFRLENKMENKVIYKQERNV